MKILEFGSSNLDYVYSMDHIVSKGETETSYKLEVFPGGKGLNQSIAIARAGEKVYHAGCIGNDADLLIKTFIQDGVDISSVYHVNAKNGHAIIQVDKSGENSIFLYVGSNGLITKEYVDKVLLMCENGDILLVQNEINNIEYIINMAHQKGMIIVFNPSPVNEKVYKVDLNIIDYIVLNEIEAKSISHCSNYRESITWLKDNYCGLHILLTLGSRGSIYVYNDIYYYTPAFNVNVVDTTAAGDTFTGYFVAGLSQNKAYIDNIRIATCASALAVTKKGAATSIPYIDDIKNNINGMKIREWKNVNE